MNCQHEDSMGLPYCRQCGVQLAGRQCSAHHFNPDDALFCGQCGEDLRHRQVEAETTAFLRFDLRLMLREAEEDEHQAIIRKEMVSQEDIRRLLKKRRQHQ